MPVISSKPTAAQITALADQQRDAKIAALREARLSGQKRKPKAGPFFKPQEFVPRRLHHIGTLEEWTAWRAHETERARELARLNTRPWPED